MALVEGRIVYSVRPDGPPEPVVHAEAWEAGATLHAALAQHPAPTHLTQEEDESDGQEHALLGDLLSRVRRRAAGMTLENIQQALEQAQFEERCADRHADAGHESAYAPAADTLAEWQRIHDHTAATRAERYDPDHDTALQHALRREHHRQDIAECAREAAHQARQTTDAAQRSLAGPTAQPLYTALDRAGLHALTDDDHQAVRDLARHVDPATLRQVTSWLERTRTAAFALRGTEQARPPGPSYGAASSDRPCGPSEPAAPSVAGGPPAAPPPGGRARPQPPPPPPAPPPPPRAPPGGPPRRKTTAPCQAHAADSRGTCPVAELRTVQTRLLALLERYADGPPSMDYRFSPDETTQRAIRLLAARLNVRPRAVRRTDQ
ncbi:hypothetical protein [Kitasatospora sp. NPDC017646]|uniref:hypothetical protein n=1 Tax=Kitasatospora sp. NPDC017646 TaxID=3364024 RepID=UPI0037947263